MQSQIYEVITSKSSRHAEDKAGNGRDADGDPSSVAIGDEPGEEHGDKHARVVDCPDEGSLPVLTSKVKLKGIAKKKQIKNAFFRAG